VQQSQGKPDRLVSLPLQPANSDTQCLVPVCKKGRQVTDGMCLRKKALKPARKITLSLCTQTHLPHLELPARQFNDGPIFKKALKWE